MFSLDTHGTNFGTIVTRPGLGNVQLKLEGIGFPQILSQAEPDPSEQLVVHPFGRKGDAFTMRDFDRGAMRFHFGMQPVEIPEIGHTDEDQDGVTDEIEVSEMTVLHICDVTNPRPFMEPLDPDTQIGFDNFEAVGCADCHHPEVITDSPFLPLAQPEDPTDPWADVYLQIDLRDFGFDEAPNGGVVVPMFSDLKRHYMGEDLKETCEGCRVPNGDFITARRRRRRGPGGRRQREYASSRRRHGKPTRGCQGAPGGSSPKREPALRPPPRRFTAGSCHQARHGPVARNPPLPPSPGARRANPRRRCAS